MSDIEDWLQRHDLGKYAALFAESEITLGDLSELTDEDVKELGLPLGPRKRLLRAIREMPEPGATNPDSSASMAPARVEAERRQLTVMFCDLVGSVALGEGMELEDYRELLGDFRQTVVQVIERFSGFVARHQGDGLLVYFGYPHAREDDAERAVRAGLEVVRAVAGLRRKDLRPRVRVGIATGPAIVGDVLSTGASEHSEFAALGSTPNLAARLQGQSQPNQVLVSDTTQHLTSGRFEYERTTQTLRGIEGDVIAYRALSEKSSASRLDITSGRQLTPLVGREEELALLSRRWQQALEGSGQVALICAEPGVGKTRMMMETYRRFGESACEAILLFCSPNHTSTTLYPIIDYLARKLEFEQTSANAERLDKMERWIDMLELSKERIVPLLAPLLSITLAEHYSKVELQGAEWRRRTMNTLIELVVAQCQRRPLLLAVEDLHWVDPTTLELLGLLIEEIRQRRIFTLITFRPEFDQPWRNQPHLTTLTLNHLTGSQCRELLRGLESDHALPTELVEQIVSRTDGIPLFVEELHKTVLETSADSRHAIPATLRDALAARLDRLGDAKRAAQVAAVIGRVFPRSLLEAACGIDPHTLSANLSQLVSSGLVYRRTLGGSDDYAFKHALIRDCAYQSLLRDQRQALHRRVALELSSARTETPAPPDLIARHFSDAAEPERALPFWQQAGEDAEGRGAFTEALDHYDAAMASLEERAHPADALLRLALGRARCQHFLGQRAEALHVLLQHRSAVEAIGDLELTGRFFVFLGRMQAFHGRREDSIKSFERAITAAHDCGDAHTEGNAYALLARDHGHRGRMNAAIENFEKAIERLRAVGPTWELGDAYFRYGYLFAHFATDFERALATADELVAVATQLDDDRLGTIALVVRGLALTFLGDWTAAEKTLSDSIHLAPNEYERVFAMVHLNMLYLETGKAEIALSLLESNMVNLGQYRSQEVRSFALSWMARALLMLGRQDEAHEQAQRALSLANELEFPISAQEATRVLGLIAHAAGEFEHAAACLRRALTIAKTHFGPFHTGRCRLDLASVLFDAQQPGAATEALIAAHADLATCGARKYIERARALAAENNLAI